MHVAGKVPAHAGSETQDGFADYGPVHVDTTPPLATTLTVNVSTLTPTVTLKWQVPNDLFLGALNSNIGYFRIQYSATPNPPWDPNQYNSRISNNGYPADAWVSYTIADLQSATSYYFTLWSEDFAGNISPISNSALAYTMSSFIARPVIKGIGDTTGDCVADIQT